MQSLASLSLNEKACESHEIGRGQACKQLQLLSLGNIFNFSQRNSNQGRPLPNGLSIGQHVFKAFVPHVCICSCYSYMAWEKLHMHMHFCISECLHIGLLMHLPLWICFGLTGGCEPVYLCLFMYLHSGCLLVWAAFPSTYVSVATCLIA